PVASAEGVRRAGDVADEVVCLSVPQPFGYVGAHYAQFPPVEDAEVMKALQAGSARPAVSRGVQIPAGTVTLPGELTLPTEPRGLIVFVHGSGSSRLSPRNRQVAQVMNRAGFATLLFDLLTEFEDVRRDARFDIPRLVARLTHALDWVATQHDLARLPLALFGASTGSAVALTAAASGRHEVVAVVSRGGRPDLAGESVLQRVRVPTLLIVGGEDRDVLALNEASARLLGARARLDVIPGATHLFEEHGALARAADHALDWFLQYMPDTAAPQVQADATESARRHTPPH
ncbi:alpha/beta family hydrolase, partial [Cognatilysobacter lacus]|uniref:alpha/beta family hydrolase n=1 Tax=Cognatilysobacter lacus TaxID=1643323 RepID=UPI002E270D69